MIYFLTLVSSVMDIIILFSFRIMYDHTDLLTLWEL
jgi:hypothetical protein